MRTLQAPEALISHSSGLRWRIVTRQAPWITALFLAGIMIDYGGGFKIKLILGFLALGWVLTRRATLGIWARCKSDLLILFFLPLMMGLAHIGIGLGSSFGPGLTKSLADLYETLSSWMLILLIPMFYMAGGLRSIKQVATGLRLVALVVIAMTLLHSLGIIDLAAWGQLAREYRVGNIGLDPQLSGVNNNLRPAVSLRVAFALPLGFGLSLALSSIWAIAIAFAVLVMKSRGLLLGIALATALWMFLGFRVRLGRQQVAALALFSVLGLGLLVVRTDMINTVAELITTTTQELSSSANRAVGAQDLSTQVRLGHWEGYQDLVRRRPLVMLLGGGPSVQILNPVLGATIGMTEISILNITMWYGAPYMLLQLAWFYLTALSLLMKRWRPGYTTLDTGLAIGAMAFWVTGNTNPLFTSPLSVIALILIRVRLMELDAQQSPGDVQQPEGLPQPIQ